jgi:hypothetical protein
MKRALALLLLISPGAFAQTMLVTAVPQIPWPTSCTITPTVFKSRLLFADAYDLFRKLRL